jgi:WD40 repeat protein/transcriptional regulator with XRE-family HTH domain/energy-coupling factor transporter ATP-binding protein EcfA2
MDLPLETNIPYSFNTFGDLLKYLRRRAHLTQLELSIIVGYSEAQISRLEKNLRLPDLTALKALFIPALHLEDEPQLADRFLELAQSSRQEDAPTPGIPPYKGLLFFDESDSELFYGREVLTARLAEHVMDLAMDASTRFLAVVGASGSGKSSLVRAGLAVALKRAGWEVIVFTPTPIPIWMMETNLNRSRIESAERVLIIVDQFEELFTLCHDEIERINYIDQLLSLAQDKLKKITVVIALRADFYSHCAQYPLLCRAISAEQEYIGQMTPGELRHAIEEPARHGGWEFEPGLVDLLLNEIGVHGSHEPESGALPLLSHALLATWERRRGRMFTLDGYHASGGVHGAIAETAESVFTDLLNQEQQGIAHDVFLRLTELGEGTEDTRRRAALKELVRYPEEATQLRTVLSTLAEARLITLNEDSAEVAHEALIREWQRLHEWLTQDREGLLLHRHLTEAAHEWDARMHDPSELYRGARLAQVREWASTNEDKMNVGERTFLAASIELEEHDALEREAQRQRELEAAQKLAETQSHAAKQLHRRAIILTGAFTLAILLAGIALSFANQAHQQAKVSSSRELAAAAISNLENDPERSILLALQAEKLADTLEAQNTLHRSILASRVMLVLHHDAEVWSVAYSPDGKRIASASQDKTAKIWNASTGELVLTLMGHSGSVNGIAYSPDGKRIATASDDHTARVWDAATGEELLTLSGHTDWVYRIAFSPDGARLVTTSNDKTARVWDAQTGTEMLTFTRHGDVVFDAAFSPDGKRIATCGFDGTVRIWDSSSGEELLVLPIEKEIPGKIAPHGVAFSPDGKFVAVASNSVAAKMWDATTGKLVSSNNPGSSQTLLDITFKSDGKLAATAGFNNKAEVWDPVTGQVLYTLSGHSGVVNGVAFSPDGTRLATASWDHTVRVWDITEAKESLFIPIPAYWSKYISYSPDGTRIVTDYPAENTVKIWDAISGNELAVLSAPTAQIVAAVYNPDGKTIAAVYDDKSIVIWDAKTGNQVTTLVGHTGNVSSGSFSSDGSRFASGSNNGEIFIWDVASGKVIRTLQGPTSSSSPATTDYTITALAFSPDGNRLISGDTNGFGTMWDVNSGEKLLIISSQAGSLEVAYIPDVISSVAYSPDGKYVTITSDRGVIKILNASTGKEFLAWNDHATGVSSVMFSPDGKLIANASYDGTAKIWEASTGKNLLTLPVPGASFISFSPDGKRLAVGGESGVYVFVLPIEDLVTLAKSRLTRTLTAEECQQYLHVETCPVDQ